ncbi:Riboflavin synthase, alpha subunit [uncultured delta proteobacterium]|uniref:Riboflavin synthase n=1 Tax=uncultured delta proteobacterium TaxID=34034 RepID=A0A212JER8_9DELT|nr:Riboflavin synthase, alpha subunit [uncultured delta proteobacterium]
MFTGIIQCLGDVVARKGSSRETRFTIMPRAPFPDPEIGESIAVNGTCLTAERFDGASFTAYASGETLSATTLTSLQPGGVVNLERAVSLSTRLGGHLVSGHVDCVATVAAIEKRGDSTVFRLAFPRAMGHLVVPKGSVTLDGVSLTINECGPDFFTVNIIPETITATMLHSWKAGTLVNMETDLIGKYVARMVATGYVNNAGTSLEESSGLTMDFLRKHGF